MAPDSDLLLPLALVLAIIAILLGGAYLSATRDAHPLILAAQATVAPTRKEGETAVHKHAEISYQQLPRSGLDILHGYRVRAGNLFDCWHVALEANRKTPKGITVAGQRFTYWEMQGLFAQFTAQFPPETTRVYFHHPDLASLGGFVAMVGCLVNGLTVVTGPSIDELDPTAPGPFVADETAPGVMVSGKAAPGAQRANVFFSGAFAPVRTSAAPAFAYEYTPAADTIIPLVADGTIYTQQNFTSAIANHVKNLPLDQELRLEDVVLLGIGATPEWDLVKLFASFLTNNEIVVERDTAITPERVADAAATVLCLSEKTAAALVATPLPRLPRALLPLSLRLIPNGNHSTFSQAPAFRTVRLVYVTSVSTAIPLTSANQIRLRAVCGARVIINRHFQGNILSPLFNTFIHDTRPITDTVMVNRGCIPQCLEVKLRDSVNPASQRVLNQGQGEVLVRGFSIGKRLAAARVEEAEGWMPTGIYGKFGPDGCFYEYR